METAINYYLYDMWGPPDDPSSYSASRLKGHRLSSLSLRLRVAVESNYSISLTDGPFALAPQCMRRRRRRRRVAALAAAVSLRAVPPPPPPAPPRPRGASGGDAHASESGTGRAIAVDEFAGIARIRIVKVRGRVGCVCLRLRSGGGWNWGSVVLIHSVCVRCCCGFVRVVLIWLVATGGYAVQGQVHRVPLAGRAHVPHREV